MSDRALAAQVVVRRDADFTLDIDLTAASGRTVAVLGPNGAGKSTVVAALAGLLPISSGRITHGAIVLDDPRTGVFVPAADRRVGVMFQDYLLFPHMTVRQNVAFGLSSRHMGRPEIDGLVTHWLEDLQLAELSDALPRDLSGGQAQQVALARALILNPAFLLLDEPLAALDVTTRSRFRRLLGQHLDRFDGPRVFITHDPTEAFLLADTIYILEGGRITQTGTADEIRVRPRTPYAADLAGANLLTGSLSAGSLTIDGHVLHVADQHSSGPVLATVHPRAIALYQEQPDGSPRNTWRSTVALVEDLGERVRIQVGSPLALTAEITPGSRTGLGLEPGVDVWVSIKATEIDVIEQ